VTHVEIAMTHGCAVVAGGRVRCWGSNQLGQLGDGTTNTHGQPVDVAGLQGVVDVALTAFSTCARMRDGSVQCWGSHQVGELALGAAATAQGETCESRMTGTPMDVPCRRRPTPVPGLTGVAQLTGGSSHACALLEDGTARCWGHNEWGQLGDGAMGFENNRAAPVTVQGLRDAAGLAAGGYHTCAWLRDGTVRCWGEGRQGQHGPGAPAEPAPRPIAVAGLAGVTALAADDAFTCALRRDGSVRCWGDTRGLANGCRDPNASAILSCRPAPAPAPPLEGAAQIDVGGRHACARMGDGTVSCWGDDYAGELGRP
jgi:alpha-tubulin suppressor-like RCC1 family protein